MSDLRSLLIAHSTIDLAKLPDEPRSWVQGSIQQRERIALVAELCVQNCPGDLIEIGCLHGGTTIHLAPIAKAYDRRLICVDPWPSKSLDVDDTDYGDSFAVFEERLRPWWDILDIFKMSSMDIIAISTIQSRFLAFAFVDGLHSYEAALSDINTVFHAGIIAVDDILWNGDVRRAYDVAEREKVWLDYNREGYLV